MISATDIQAQMTAPPQALERMPTKTMGQTEFLSLLVTQMRNQLQIRNSSLKWLSLLAWSKLRK